MNLLLDKDKSGHPVQLNDLDISLINYNFNVGTQMWGHITHCNKSKKIISQIYSASYALKFKITEKFNQLKRL